MQGFDSDLFRQAVLEALVYLSQGSGRGATLAPARTGDGSPRVAVEGAMVGGKHRSDRRGGDLWRKLG